MPMFFTHKIQVLTSAKPLHGFYLLVRPLASPPSIDHEQYPTLAPNPVPGPTTPSIRPVYPSPEENLFSKCETRRV